MIYSIQELSNQRWGMFTQNRLLATFGSHHTCLKVLELLQARNKTQFITCKPIASKFKQAA